MIPGCTVRFGNADLGTASVVTCSATGTGDALTTGYVVDMTRCRAELTFSFECLKVFWAPTPPAPRRLRALPGRRVDWIRNWIARTLVSGQRGT